MKKIYCKCPNCGKLFRFEKCATCNRKPKDCQCEKCFPHNTTTYCGKLIIVGFVFR